MHYRLARPSRWAFAGAVLAIALFQAGGALLAYRPATALLLACPQALGQNLSAYVGVDLKAVATLAEVVR